MHLIKILDLDPVVISEGLVSVNEVEVALHRACLWDWTTPALAAAVQLAHDLAPGLLAQSQHRLTGTPMRRSYSASQRP